MNIVTAPFTLLFVGFPMRSNLVDGPPSPPSPDSFLGRLGHMVAFFLATSTLLTFGIVIVGVYILVAGTSGDIEVSGLGVEIKTKTGGLALIAIGLIFYLAIGKLIVDRMKN